MNFKLSRLQLVNLEITAHHRPKVCIENAILSGLALEFCDNIKESVVPCIVRSKYDMIMDFCRRLAGVASWSCV